ncbi:universal stress protein [Spongiactinospora gelatinilytica]|uniref:Universal stress protein n=1 Tax=Spongiactinospora gelatinilytica TaxID=2666298 RepID=A0A2W2F7T4_9ACTN|nr:universal stress protein [Spongiactinospora gelatinilytica]PZG25589.1 universal stress protein [Spongiactinospora gelatinilytica]
MTYCDQWLVVGFDRHPAARTALETAASLALRLPARLLVAHVLDLDDYPLDPDAADWEAAAGQAVAAERAQAAELLTGHPLPWTFQVEHGEPAPRLLDLAARHDALMIVIGAARHELGAHLLTGSVARHLTQHADRPVLLVPVAGPGTSGPPDRPRSGGQGASYPRE